MQERRPARGQRPECAGQERDARCSGRTREARDAAGACPDHGLLERRERAVVVRVGRHRAEEREEDEGSRCGRSGRSPDRPRRGSPAGAPYVRRRPERSPTMPTTIADNAIPARIAAPTSPTSSALRATGREHRTQDHRPEPVEERADGLDPQDDPEVALDVHGRHALTPPQNVTPTTVQNHSTAAVMPSQNPRMAPAMRARPERRAGAQGAPHRALPRARRRATAPSPTR